MMTLSIMALTLLCMSVFYAKCHNAECRGALNGNQQKR
jgi:hypothetical protein